MSEDILTARTREHRSKLGNRDGSEQSVEPARYPDADEQPAVGQLPGNGARSADDARAYCVANYNGKPKPYAEDSK